MATRRTIALLAMLAVLVAGLAVFLARYPASGPPPPPSSASEPDGFRPPDAASIPEGPEGDAIRRGRELFLHTGQKARPFVGSGLTCGNCHLDAGTKADASPMWAAWGMYPAYRSKTDSINTMEDRIYGCFVYSMNAQASPAGAPPPYGDDIYRDLQAYFAWLATGLPMRTEFPGRGFLKLEVPSGGFDPARGRQVFAEHCSVCHGEDGQGVANPDGTYIYPPLWGAASFNWGAGMSKTANAAGFIKANMPLGNDGILTDRQAWDVAAFITSRERPRDPRQTGTVEQARAQFHKDGDYYGQTIDGDRLGDGVP